MRPKTPFQLIKGHVLVILHLRFTQGHRVPRSAGVRRGAAPILQFHVSALFGGLGSFNLKDNINPEEV